MAPSATQNLRKALEIDPKLVPAQKALVRIALAENRGADALNVARSLQKQRPTLALGYSLETDIHASRRDWEPAIASARTALDRDRSSRIAIRLHSLYSVAGHMHLRGRDIRLELNAGTSSAKTLLHIPKWDFHWQGNYWFKTPVEVKKGDTIRVSCTYDNSTNNQPVIGDKPATPRYIVWGEGTTDEMCLGIISSSPK